ncbi:MAG: hypothetical protein ACXVB7_20785 [Ktedonobacteraceae bacterium]
MASSHLLTIGSSAKTSSSIVWEGAASQAVHVHWRCTLIGQLPGNDQPTNTLDAAISFRHMGMSAMGVARPILFNYSISDAENPI